LIAINPSHFPAAIIKAYNETNGYLFILYYITFASNDKVAPNRAAVSGKCAGQVSGYWTPGTFTAVFSSKE